MADVIIYTTGTCPYCVQAKRLLDKKGALYREIRVDQDIAQRNVMVERSGRRTVPQIAINGQYIGGCDALYASEQSGQLDELLRGTDHG